MKIAYASLTDTSTPTILAKTLLQETGAASAFKVTSSVSSKKPNLTNALMKAGKPSYLVTFKNQLIYFNFFFLMKITLMFHE